ncbi:MAG TPA: Stk1 family PASTA domain-containing Ser/Thr kinase [Bacillales bacterium]|nr:Stk1 family PASTA domain-containing Ser/Thr kinase [Bacillales bacterium]
MLGKRIGDRYELLSVVGGGGMAVVYKARDLILDRIVAVKVLRSEFSDDDEFIRRFRREAQSVASLSQPNIVNIYDIGDDGGENYYIVMEYIEGETLKDLIRREAPLPLGQALHIIDQITSAIEHAHEQNIVHRDIKPQNILIDTGGHTKVTDFGIAVAVTSATITHTKSVIGSAHYFSPEQAKGSYANTKSDIYSLGIVLFEMLTGELPFSGTSPVSIALKHLQEDIPDPRELNPAIPQSVENIILKALSKDPVHRYETVGDMKEDLKTALNPDRLNEPKFAVPSDGEQTTKVMTPVDVVENGSGNGNGGNRNSGNSNDQSHDPDGGPKKKRLLPKVLLTIFLILLLLGGAAVAAFGILPDLLYVENVKVPNVVGMDIDKAQTVLKKKGLKVDTEKVTSSEYDEDKVVRQNPSAKTPVKKGHTVHLFVSKGPETITLDSYIMKDKDSVALLLDESNFKEVKFEGRYSDSYPEGTVFDQEPDASTSVVPGQTTLVLFYSKGPRTTEVPDLTGMTEQEATEALEAAGLRTGDQGEEYSGEVEKGKVISQSPESGTEVELDETVSFTISKGPKPEPTPTPTPTPTPQPEDGQGEPISFYQPIKVQVDPPGKSGGNGKGQGKAVHVKIVYSDADHDHQLFVEEDISETKVYDELQMTVKPGGSVTVWVYTDGKLKDTIHKEYEKVKNETSDEEQ